ncbi:hypothetical protein JCM10599A_43420 [Paraburkholderia kururiensis]
MRHEVGAAARRFLKATRDAKQFKSDAQGYFAGFTQTRRLKRLRPETLHAWDRRLIALGKFRYPAPTLTTSYNSDRQRRNKRASNLQYTFPQDSFANCLVVASIRSGSQRDLCRPFT